MIIEKILELKASTVLQNTVHGFKKKRNPSIQEMLQSLTLGHMAAVAIVKHLICVTRLQFE